jgi:MYXO-CTERM domain-containing protein
MFRYVTSSLLLCCAAILFMPTQASAQNASFNSGTYTTTYTTSFASRGLSFTVPTQSGLSMQITALRVPDADSSGLPQNLSVWDIDNNTNLFEAPNGPTDESWVATSVVIAPGTEVCVLGNRGSSSNKNFYGQSMPYSVVIDGQNVDLARCTGSGNINPNSITSSAVSSSGQIGLIDVEYTMVTDSDGDGDPATTDCDDNDPLVTTLDTDGDGVTTCDATPDCDDNDIANFPGNTEVCDGQDNDCDTLANFDAAGEVDGDGDTSLSCDDCDDTDPLINGLDLDGDGQDTCPGFVDVCYTLDMADSWGDGWNGGELSLTIDGVLIGDYAAVGSGSSELLCGPPDVVWELSYSSGSYENENTYTLSDPNGTVVVSDGPNPTTGVVWTDTPVGTPLPGDCDDNDAANFPGNTEICDGQDNDCDAATTFSNAQGDENDDIDGDGDPACSDCDDNDAFATNLDSDGDGVVSCPAPPADVCYTLDMADSWGDGWNGGELSLTIDGVLIGDYAAVGSGSSEALCGPSGSTWELSYSSGSYESENTYTLSDPNGTVVFSDGPTPATGVVWTEAVAVVVGGGDCDDNDAANFPGNTEICDGGDNNCSGSPDFDALGEADYDVDGQRTCEGDCDDNDPNNFDGNVEACDGADNDCNGFADFLIPMGDDDDDDSAGDDDDSAGDDDDSAGDDDDSAGDDDDSAGDDDDSAGDDDDSAEAPESDELDLDMDGYLLCGDDCDDEDANTYTGAVESCDAIDNDCDGVVPADEDDADMDGQKGCEGDCDDADATTNTNAAEVCDGVDNDCDGSIADEELDDDSDGQAPCDGDCDDKNADTYVGAEELCDGFDNACDGELDADEADADADGSLACDGDCDDNDAANFTGNTEVCDDEADNDCDDLVDLDDTEDCEETGDDDDDDDGGRDGGSDCNCSAASSAGNAGYGLLLLGLLGLVRRRRS